MFRVFGNPHQVPAAVLAIRLRQADPRGIVETFAHEFDGGTIQHYARVDSVLSDAQILAGLGAMTQAEIDGQARFYGARNTAGLSTLLKTMTAAQAETYINANVTSLATAKTVLIELSRLVIALRDAVWQDIQG